MLDRLTGGWYRSTPHRVLSSSGRGRLSFPLFFDPDFDANLPALPTLARCGAEIAAEPRWDNANLQAFEGTYGDYLMGKVSKVFPKLAKGLDRNEPNAASAWSRSGRDLASNQPATGLPRYIRGHPGRLIDVRRFPGGDF